MKHVRTLISTAALMLNLGVASVYAQHLPVMLSFSGTSVSSTITIQAGASTGEYNLNGTGTLGPFSLTTLEASSQPPGACPAADHPYVGSGVFRFQDGSLLIVSLTQGSDCLEFTATGPVAHCTRTFQVTGGTGRFKNASGGTIALTETVLAVLFDGTSNPVFFAATGQMTGTLSGAAMAVHQDGPQ
ncbi:MAG TPA: hypothetical protein VKX49_11695 [Bryobacteraceae bacterium]|nr:hypothetical protein [Bryobacteraceae bacterium]